MITTIAILYMGITLHSWNDLINPMNHSNKKLQPTDTLCFPPENYGIVNINAHSARLVWSGLTSATSYRIRLFKAHEMLMDTIVQSMNRIDFLNLQEATHYQTQIAAICDNQTSIFTDWASWTTLISPECNIPTGLNVGWVTDSAARIDWDQINNSTGYMLHYKKWNSNRWDSIRVNSNGLNLNSLSADNNYQCKVMAVCGLKKSSFSQPVNFTIPASTRCNTPTDIKLVSLTDYHALWKWSGFLSNSKFALQYKCSDDSGWSEALVSDTFGVNPIRIPGKPMEIRLQRLCLFGRSEFSPVIRMNTIPIKDTIDVFEPNDNIVSATKIFPPVNIKGNLRMKSDEDWFIFHNASSENKWTLQMSSIQEEIELILMDTLKNLIQHWTLNKECNRDKINYVIDSGFYYLCIKKKNRYDEILITDTVGQVFSRSGFFQATSYDFEKSAENNSTRNYTWKITYVGSYPISIKQFDVISFHPILFLQSRTGFHLHDRNINTGNISDFKNSILNPGDNFTLSYCEHENNLQNSALQLTTKISFENTLNTDRDHRAYHLKIFAEQ